MHPAGLVSVGVSMGLFVLPGPLAGDVTLEKTVTIILSVTVENKVVVTVTGLHVPVAISFPVSVSVFVPVSVSVFVSVSGEEVSDDIGASGAGVPSQLEVMSLAGVVSGVVVE